MPDDETGETHPLGSGGPEQSPEASGGNDDDSRESARFRSVLNRSGTGEIDAADEDPLSKELNGNSKSKFWKYATRGVLGIFGTGLAIIGGAILYNHFAREEPSDVPAEVQDSDNEISDIVAEPQPALPEPQPAQEPQAPEQVIQVPEHVVSPPEPVIEVAEATGRPKVDYGAIGLKKLHRQGLEEKAAPASAAPVAPRITVPANPREVLQQTGRPAANLDELGLARWKEAQKEREASVSTQKGRTIGWDTYYDAVENPFGSDLGSDGLGIALRARARLTTQSPSIDAAFRLDAEPFESQRGADGLRLILFGEGRRSTYKRGTSADLLTEQARFLAAVEKYFKMGRLNFKIGLGCRMMDWGSEGGNAPDQIAYAIPGANLGLIDPQTGVEIAIQRYAGEGSYEYLGQSNNLDVDDFFAAIRWNIRNSRGFAGVEYQDSVNDYEQAVEVKDKQVTLYGGLRDFGNIDEAAIGLVVSSREQSVGDNYQRIGLEARATWYKTDKGWFRASLIAREPTPQNEDEGFDVGMGIEAGVKF